MVKVSFDTSEIERATRRLSLVLSDQSVEEALAGGGFVLQEIAQVEAPVDHGNLRQSLHVGGYNGKSHVDADEPWNNYEDIGGNGRFGGVVQVLMGTSIVYGPAVEFGDDKIVNTGMRAVLRFLGYHISDSTSVVQTPSQPYMRPAFNRGWRRALNKIAEILRNRIKRALI